AGYQSVGTRPESAPLATSNTATELLSASATNSRLPSSERASAFGVLPSRGPAGGASLICLISLEVAVSITEIVSVRADVTQRRFCLSSKAEGCRPALIGARLANIPFAATLNMSTVWSPQQ